MSRYIDADKLLKGYEDHELISTHLIWNAPTADVVEIRHGYWKVYKDLGYRFVKNYQCSECGDIIGDVNYNYCPNCGARMDGDEE